MVRYIAFLRGINVSGQKLIKMAILRKAMTDAGFSDVATYIQSGNIAFDTVESDSGLIAGRIEDLIENTFGFRTDAIVRNRSEIVVIVNSQGFSELQSDDEKKYYISFLKVGYPGPFTVPEYSKNRDIEIYYKGRMEFYSICTLYKGNYGFPNAYIEKLTGIPATTRNPITLRKITEL